MLVPIGPLRHWQQYHTVLIVEVSGVLYVGKKVEGKDSVGEQVLRIDLLW